MAGKRTCGKCGGRRLDDAVTAGIFGVRSTTATPRGRLIKVRSGTPLARAEVCLDCGCTALFVDPAEYAKTRS